MYDDLKEGVSGKHIGILDDSNSCVLMMELWLRQTFKDINVNVFTDYKKFLKEIEFAYYDCFLIDYFLDDNIFAPDIVKEIRKYDKDVLIFVVSSNFIKEDKILTDDMMKSMSAGANRAITKQRSVIENALMSHFYIRNKQQREHLVSG